MPWPLNTGAKSRTRALLDALTREFAVDYAGFLQPDLPRDEALRSLAGCAEVFLAPEPATSLVGKATLVLGNVVDWRPATLAKYDDGDLRRHAVQWMGRHPGAIVHADHLHMAGYLGMGPAGIKAIDEHNVEAQIVERMAERYHRQWLKPWLLAQARRMRACEARLAGEADLVLAVSEGDAAMLRGMAPGTEVLVVPNGVDLEYFAPPAEGNARVARRLVFTGSMNWLPNEDGMLWFCEAIWPLLAGDAPAWSLDIVGHQPSAPVQALAGKQVRVTGSVPDVRDYVHAGEVFIVPLRIGGGSRLKILEAFSMGIPVVSTAVGCEGLGAVDGRHLLIADTPEAFVAAIRRVAEDKGLAVELAAQAQRHVRDHFAWGASGGALAARYRGSAAG